MKKLLGNTRLRGLFIGFLILASTAHAKDDLQWWPSIYARVWNHNEHSLKLYAESWQIDDASTQRLWLTSVRYGYSWQQNLALGLNYTYLDIRNLKNQKWNSRSRFELEINPHFALDENWKLYFRNRLEVSYDDLQTSAGKLRSRHRVQFSRKLSLGRLTKFYANSEFFYSYDSDRWSECRTVPIGFQVKLSDPIKLNLHYMVQSKRKGRTSEWDHNHVLGTMFVVKF